MRRVLPTHYFHVVFTLPAELHSVARRNRAVVFDILLRCAAESLLELGHDPKWLGADAQLGVTTVLHTWARDLRFHPHVHCIVTGGGLALDGSRWIGGSPRFLFPVRVLGALFRGKVLAQLSLARNSGRVALAPDVTHADFLRQLCRLRRRRKAWVVYAKRPFGGPEQVHAYLGRYTHRVAISNARLVAADEHTVTFRTRGQQTVTVASLEFVRRFLEHVLPRGFVKIRHYGLLASSNVSTRLEQARALLASRCEEATPSTDTARPWQTILLELTGIDATVCPRCRHATLQRRPLVPALATARAPPDSEAAA
jgi:hypothetical protein